MQLIQFHPNGKDKTIKKDNYGPLIMKETISPNLTNQTNDNHSNYLTHSLCVWLCFRMIRRHNYERFTCRGRRRAPEGLWVMAFRVTDTADDLR